MDKQSTLDNALLSYKQPVAEIRVQLLRYN